MADIVNATDATFEAELQSSELPVLVEFWASWCGPCTMVKPIVEGIAADFEDQLKVVKVDIDSNNETCKKYGIRTVPAFMIFKGGKQVASTSGAKSSADMHKFVQSNL